MRRIEASDIKARYTVLDVWRMLMPHSCPAKDGVVHSPFRDDRTPSFSVSKQGNRWKDFASDEGGDCIDFYARATGCSTADAIQKLAEGLGQAPVLPPPPPKRKPVHVVTAEQRELEQRACDGFADAISDTESVLYRLLKKKQIDFSVAARLWKEGSLGAIDGKPVYLNAFGVKCRNDLDSSRSTRWLAGSDCGYVWRNQCLASPHLKTVYLVEGESDGMRLMSLLPQGLRTVITAMPGASWKPSADYCFYIGGHRNVVIWTDSDSAGIKVADRLEQSFSRVSHCKVFKVTYPDTWPKDICDSSEDQIKKIISRIRFEHEQ